MKVYFNNDGQYNQENVNIPILVNDMPIGFVSEVNNERVTCYLWDKFVKADKYLKKMNPIEQEIRSISINTK